MTGPNGSGASAPGPEGDPALDVFRETFAALQAVAAAGLNEFAQTHIDEARLLADTLSTELGSRERAIGCAVGLATLGGVMRMSWPHPDGAPAEVSEFVTMIADFGMAVVIAHDELLER